MLWSGLVSQFGASHRDTLIAPFPLEEKCPRKITMKYTYYGVLEFKNKRFSFVFVFKKSKNSFDQVLKLTIH